VTEPWTGEGVDPWLPDRIGFAEQAAAAEMAVRKQVWAELSGWLVDVSRVVLATVRPDPIAVFSQQPAWSAAVNRIVSDTITDTIGTAYKTMLGEGYRFESRPMVVDHLAQVTNRMVRTPEQVFDLVASEVAQGAELGESIPKIANRIEDVLDATHTERWANRATVVARTECLLGNSIVASDGIEAVYRRWYEGPIFRIHTASSQQFSGTANHPILTSRGWIGFRDLVPGDELVNNSFTQCVRTATNEYISDVPSSISQIYDALAAVGIVVRAKTGQPDFHGDGMNGYVDVATTNRVLADRIISTGTEHVEDLIFESSNTNDFLLPCLCDLLTICCQSGTTHNSEWAETPLDRVLRHAMLTRKIRSADPRQVLENQGININIHPSRSMFSTKMELGVLRFLHSSQDNTSFNQDPFYHIGISPIQRCQLTQTLPIFVRRHYRRYVDVISSGNGHSLTLSKRRYPGIGQYGPNSSGMDAVRLLNSVDAVSRPIGVDHVVRIDVVPFSGHVYNLTTRRGWFNYGPLYSGNTMGALNAGRTDAFAAVAEETGDEFEQVWLATIDRRTRSTHKTADGQRVPVGQPFTVGGSSLRYPGDPLGPAKETIQCRCSSLLTEPGETLDLSNRQFRTG
jgi:hypothetical protein